MPSSTHNLYDITLQDLWPRSHNEDPVHYSKTVLLLVCTKYRAVVLQYVGHEWRTEWWLHMGTKKHVVGGISHVSEIETFFILLHTKFSVFLMHQQWYKLMESLVKIFLMSHSTACLYSVIKEFCVANWLLSSSQRETAEKLGASTAGPEGNWQCFWAKLS